VPTQINGLPAHVLLVHAVIAVIPLAAAALVVSAVWPAARRRLGVVTPALALVALVFIPITTNAGEWLQDHLPNGIGHTSPAIRKHVDLGHGLLPWAVGILVMSALVWWLARRYDLSWRSTAAPASDAAASAGPAVPAVPARRLPRWVPVVVAVLSVAVSVGGVVQLYRIGDSGAQAVWHGVISGR
jgi:hypothetical protein